jgi:hypothetical protein
MRRHGIKTAVVSDFDTRCRDLISSYGLDRAFDAIICSAEVGAEKPDPKIFQAACNKLGVEPHEVSVRTTASFHSIPRHGFALPKPFQPQRPFQHPFQVLLVFVGVHGS